MPLNLSGKHFLTLLDFSPEEIRYLLDLSRDFKNMKRAGVPHRYLEGKNIVLLFEKTSTRTRCAFEVGAMDLGMGVTYLDPGSSQMGKKESIEDTARVLGRMYDGIEYRGFEQSVVEDLAANAGVPVWNGLTAQFHPTQALADVLTMQEELGPDLRGRKLRSSARWATPPRRCSSSAPSSASILCRWGPRPTCPGTAPIVRSCGRPARSSRP